MTKRKNNRSRLGQGMQALEDRRLMAGDVDVFISSGDLVIVGDNASNRVDVAEVNGQIQVTGNNWYGGTTINNGNQPFVVNASSIDDIRIDMNNGYDRVLVNNVHLNATSHADIVIDTDSGNDLVGVYNSSARYLDIETSSGNDDVIVSYSAFNADIKVDLGIGNDELDLYGAYAGDDVRVFAADGSNDIALQGVTAVDDFYAQLGKGNDILWINGGSFEDASVYGQEGSDRVTFQGAAISDDIFVNMGSNNDQLYLYNTTVNGSKYFHGGSGSDTLGASGNNFNAYLYDWSF